MKIPRHVRCRDCSSDERWKITALKWNEGQQQWWVDLYLNDGRRAMEYSCPVTDLLPVYPASVDVIEMKEVEEAGFVG